MPQHAVATQDGTKVLAQLRMRPVFWMPCELAQCINHRYTIKPPSLDAAEAMATIYNGKAVTI
jgi:hypothetical protein